MNSYDAIIIGAGSVGVPTALALGSAGVHTLVIDRYPSPGQGENKHAIGGIRATHSSPGKILTCSRSLEIFATWQDRFGDDIEWLKGGYLFPAYTPKVETFLKEMLPVQKSYGLDIGFIGSKQVQSLVPGISARGLIGGSFSPDDGSASPLLAVNAFYRQAVSNNVTFCFKTVVEKLCVQNQKITGVKTSDDTFHAPVVIDAAGAHSRDLNQTIGLDVPVIPDSHEAAITEPVQKFFSCMVVDLRPSDGSKNYYFYQNKHGQVVFCITPDPLIVGTDKRETSVFLPQIGARMVTLMPRLKNLRVRRVWRGLYPMTPDGTPIVGWNRKVEGLLHATGMCGQGFMLGPGLGEVIARLITRASTTHDRKILEEFSPHRPFYGREEALK